jgi:S-phase kinase-associated protein 1
MAEEKAEALPTEEEAGGLDDDDDSVIKLKSGGEKPETFEINKKYASLSTFVTAILKGDEAAEEIEVRQVGAETLKHIVDYLNEHKGQEPPPLPCPVRSTSMEQICHNKWDAKFIDNFDKKTIFEIILGANYMDIKPLLHLGCAKIATLIKQLPQKEINRIIEEEQKYRREHGGDIDEEAKNEAN